MITTAIEIIHNAQSVTTVKHQSEKVVDSLSPERFYHY